jgi:hypothetical protein
MDVHACCISSLAKALLPACAASEVLRDSSCAARATTVIRRMVAASIGASGPKLTG